MLNKRINNTAVAMIRTFSITRKKEFFIGLLKMSIFIQNFNGYIIEFLTCLNDLVNSVQVSQYNERSDWKVRVVDNRRVMFLPRSCSILRSCSSSDWLNLCNSTRHSHLSLS